MGSGILTGAACHMCSSAAIILSNFSKLFRDESRYFIWRESFLHKFWSFSLFVNSFHFCQSVVLNQVVGIGNDVTHYPIIEIVQALGDSVCTLCNPFLQKEGTSNAMESIVNSFPRRASICSAREIDIIELINSRIMKIMSKNSK